MTTPTRVTVEEFLAMEETKPYLELINGEVVPKAMGWPQQSAASVHLICELGNFLTKNPTARADTQLRYLNRDEQRVFLPDLSVTLRHRWPVDARDPVEVMPDWAIEVLSPDDRASKVAERVDFYLRLGTQLVWVIDPELGNVTVYQPGAAPEFHRGTGKLNAAPVLAGFEIDLAELFRAARDE